VRMCDHSALDWIPRIDIKAPGRAVQAIRQALEQVVHRYLNLV